MTEWRNWWWIGDGRCFSRATTIRWLFEIKRERSSFEWLSLRFFFFLQKRCFPGVVFLCTFKHSKAVKYENVQFKAFFYSNPNAFFRKAQRTYWDNFLILWRALSLRKRTLFIVSSMRNLWTHFQQHVNVCLHVSHFNALRICWSLNKHSTRCLWNAIKEGALMDSIVRSRSKVGTMIV